jgi:hypothetical protein
MSLGKTLTALALAVPLTVGAIGCSQYEKSQSQNSENSANTMLTKQEVNELEQKASSPATINTEQIRSQLFDKNGNPNSEVLWEVIGLEHQYMFYDEGRLDQSAIVDFTNYLTKMKQPVNAFRAATKIKDEHQRATAAINLIPENPEKARELGNTIKDFRESYRIMQELMDAGEAKEAIYFFEYNPERFSELNDESRLSVSDYFLKSGYVRISENVAEGLNNKAKVKFAKELVDSGDSRNAVYLTETIKIGPNYENRDFVMDVLNYMENKWIESDSIKLRTDFTLLMEYVNKGIVAERG